jgi:UDP-N-acetyl-alpha-D-muramoyl-L-alanyl-L-glutamate epimerase
VRSQFEVMRFPSYAFDPATGVAAFRYELAGPSSPLAFTETVEFLPS